MKGCPTTLLICCFAWATLYFLLCLWNSKRSYEWHIRTVTVIHALTVLVLCSYSILIEGAWPFTNAGGKSSAFQSFTITVCLGYFILDFSWCVYFRTEGVTMMCHHTLSIAGLSSCLINGMWGTEMVATILGAEITNPLLQARWFLRETGKYHTPLGDFVDWAFMGMFGVFRIGIGSYLLYTYYQQDTDWLGRLGGTLIYLIGWVFWFSIIRYGIKKYRKRLLNRKGKASGVSVSAMSATDKLKSVNGSNGVVKLSPSDADRLNGNTVKDGVVPKADTATVSSALKHRTVTKVTNGHIHVPLAEGSKE